MSFPISFCPMSRWQGFYPPATREPHSLSVSISAPFVVSLDPVWLQPGEISIYTPPFYK